jgi:N6-adenosine-specific RNA methylase IME4
MVVSMDTIPLPDRKYQVIYADPPWSYKNKKTGRSGISGADTKYPTMDIEDICAMPIQGISDKSCVLFLWITCPLKPEGMMAMESWGFRYKTTIYWCKVMSLGMGYWYRGQVEECIMGIHGKVKAFHSQLPNFIQTKAGAHSAKPRKMYEVIEQSAGALTPRIELFARHTRPGWDSWGNEIPGGFQSSENARKWF